MASDYAQPDVLVSTAWVEEYRREPQVRIVESDEDVLLYKQAHIAEAVEIDWQLDLQHRVVRDYIHPEAFERLCASKGIANDTTVVFYGDKNNWWACYAFWTFKLFGHADCKIMNGGRVLWQAEGRPMVREPEPKYAATRYVAQPHNHAIRAFRDEVLAHQQARRPLIDVRSPGEYSGELLHMPDYPQEGSLRAGHIPGAKSVPWSRAVNADGTFKSRGELEQLFLQEAGLRPSDDVVAYCRIGERSSLTWFVLTYLLGFERVRNYDGSWTEWGNLVGVPIEKSV